MQIGFLLKAKEETTYRNIPAKIVEKDKTNIYNLLAPVDFGLNIGSSYYITNEFFVAIRYNVGITNISKEKDKKEKNNVFLLSIGYTF